MVMTVEKSITIDILAEWARNFLRKEYNLELGIPITRNNRLRTSMGSFVYSDEGAVGIEVAGFMFEYAAKDVMLDLLKHECVHYALYTLGREYRDGYNEFESELKRLGISATETNKVGKYYTYECSKCGEEDDSRNRRLFDNPENYMTRCCGGKIKSIEVRIYDGTEEGEWL